MYVDRVSDAMLADYLGTFGAVLVEGPKWCGKTTSAARAAASELRIADPTNNYQNKRLAELDVATALQGARPRLIDEWQEVPSTWDAVRYECDQAQGEPGQFILTGSATPRRKNRPIHSGAGRIGSVRMDTMTQQELGASAGTTSLKALFEGDAPQGVSQMSVKEAAEAVCRGGWPVARNLSVEQAMRIARSYIDAVANEDLQELDGIARDPLKIRQLIESLARNESTLASKKTIVADTEGIGLAGARVRLAESTVTDYLAALSSVFFTNDVAAWSPALRSPVRMRAAKKRHLVDPSLAAAALGVTPDGLLADTKTLGFLFESLVCHDLMVYARAMNAEVRHYRDDANLEVDYIVQAPDGRWAPFEVKLGAAQEDEGAANVCALERKMVERGECPPACKAVIVGIGAVAHVRSDGVAILPFDTLGA